jgi:hypothetical protein
MRHMANRGYYYYKFSIKTWYYSCEHFYSKISAFLQWTNYWFYLQTYSVEVHERFELI